jgi:hypothetical protein
VLVETDRRQVSMIFPGVASVMPGECYKWSKNEATQRAYSTQYLASMFAICTGLLTRGTGFDPLAGYGWFCLVYQQT